MTTPDFGNIWDKVPEANTGIPPMPRGIVPSTPAVQTGVLPTESPVETPAQQRLKKLRGALPPAPLEMEDLGATDPFDAPFFTADAPPETPGRYEGLDLPGSFSEAMQGNYIFDALGRTAMPIARGALGALIPGAPAALGLIPDPAQQQIDVQESWYALSPDVRKKLFMESFSDVYGTTADRVPMGDVPTDFDSVFARKAIQALDVGTRPLDAFAEASWQTISSDVQKGEFNPAFVEMIGDLFSDPSKMVDEEYKYIEMFRERPVLQQFAVGIIDPTILISWAAKGSKLALMLTRTDAFAARAARQVPGIGESWAARISTDIFPGQVATTRPTLEGFLGAQDVPPSSPLVQEIDPTLTGARAEPPVPYGQRFDIPWQPWLQRTTPDVPPAEVWTFDQGRMTSEPAGQLTIRYAEAQPDEPLGRILAQTPLERQAQVRSHEGSIAAKRKRIEEIQADKKARRKAPRIKRLEDEIKVLEAQLAGMAVPKAANKLVSQYSPLYRDPGSPVLTQPHGQPVEEIIVVSADHPQGQRIGLIHNQRTSRQLTELGMAGNGDFTILSGSATRAEVAEASARLLSVWAETGRNLPGNPSGVFDVGQFTDNLVWSRPAFADAIDPDLARVPGNVTVPPGSSRAVLNDILSQIPKEQLWVDEAGNALPTTRQVTGDVRAEWIPYPPGTPHAFGGYDLFRIIEETADGPETVAMVEMVKPKRSQVAEVGHFYPVVEGGGPGMLTTEAMQKVLHDIAGVYPDLMDVMIAGRQAFKQESMLNKAADVLEPGDVRIGDLARVSDSQAASINEVAPSPTSADPPPGVPQTVVSISRESGPGIRDDAAIAKEVRDMDAPTPEQLAALSERNNPIDVSDNYYRQKEYGTHERLVSAGTDAWAKIVRGLPGIPRAILGAWSRAATTRDSAIAQIGAKLERHKEIEKARAALAVHKWADESDKLFGWKQTGVTSSEILRGQRGIFRATTVDGYDPTITDSWHATIDDLLDDLDNAAEAAAAGVSYTPRYTLTDSQLRNLRQGQNMQTGTALDAQNAGAAFDLLEENYWHRILLDKDDAGFMSGIVKSFAWAYQDVRASGRRGFTRQRQIKNIEDAVTGLRYRYETNPRLRMLARMEAGIEVTANQRALSEVWTLTDIDVGLGTTGQRLFKGMDAQVITDEPFIHSTVVEARNIHKNVKARYLAMFKAATREKNPIAWDTAMEVEYRQAEANRLTAEWMNMKAGERAAAGSLFKKGEGINQHWYDPKRPGQEIFKDIQDNVFIPAIQIPKRGGNWEIARQIAQLARALITNVDAAATFINGQFVFFRKPRVWLHATAISWSAFVKNPDAFVGKNFDVMDEGMNIGAIARPTEYMFERTGLASAPTRIPFVGEVLKRFNRTFEWYVIAAQTELYKSARNDLVRVKDTPWGAAYDNADAMNQLLGLGKAIRKELGTESYAILGIRPTQQTIESVLFFAPRFFRANIGLIMQQFNTGQAGWEARKAIGSMTAGGVALTMGIHYAKTGRPANVTDPYAPDWLQVPWGDSYMNVFGPFYGYLRTVARVGYSIEQWDMEGAQRALDEGRKFIHSRSGLPVRFAEMLADAASSPYGARTFEGEKIDFTGTGLARFAEEFFAPIGTTEIIKGLNERRWESLTEFIGLQGRANPYQQLDILYQKHMKDPLNPMAEMRKETDEQARPGIPGVVPVIGGALKPSWRDATPFEQQWMAEKYPELYDESRMHAPGDWGQASAKIWENQKAAIEAEETLNKKLFNPALITTKEAVDGAQYRAAFDAIQQAKWQANQQVWEDAGMFTEQKDPLDETNPNRRAILQYREVYRNNTDLDGTMNWDKLQSDLKNLEDDWTPEQLLYVSVNTGLWHTEKGEELVNDRRALREYWDLRDKYAEEFSSNPKVQRQWKNLYDNYNRSAPTVREQLRQIKGYRTMLNHLSKRTQQWILDNGSKGEDIELLLVKWGYEIDPMTEPAINLLEEQNEMMTELALPRLRPELEMPGAVPVQPRQAAPAAQPDPIADILAGIAGR